MGVRVWSHLRVSDRLKCNCCLAVEPSPDTPLTNGESIEQDCTGLHVRRGRS